jgi:hypothetical protein
MRADHAATARHGTREGACATPGKQELNEDETARLKQLWKKLVRMFHPDLHEHDPEKRKTEE